MGHIGVWRDAWCLRWVILVFGGNMVLYDGSYWYVVRPMGMQRAQRTGAWMEGEPHGCSCIRVDAPCRRDISNPSLGPGPCTPTPIPPCAPNDLPADTSVDTPNNPIDPGPCTLAPAPASDTPPPPPAQYTGILPGMLRSGVFWDLTMRCILMYTHYIVLQYHTVIHAQMYRNMPFL